MCNLCLIWWGKGGEADSGLYQLPPSPGQRHREPLDRDGKGAVDDAPRVDSAMLYAIPTPALPGALKGSLRVGRGTDKCVLTGFAISPGVYDIELRYHNRSL